MWSASPLREEEGRQYEIVYRLSGVEQGHYPE